MTNKEKLEECNNFPQCHCGLTGDFCNVEKRVNKKIKEFNSLNVLLYGLRYENTIFSKQWLESFMKGS